MLGLVMALLFPFLRTAGAARAALLAAAGLLLLLSCRPAAAPQAARPKVLPSFTILADMAREVAGDAAEVTSLTKPGAEIHGYEPTPKDLVRAQQADLVLCNGLHLEAWFARFFQQLQGVPSAVLSDGIAPIDISDGPYRGKPNPHAWMSPAHALTYVENIRRALAGIDPAHAATYAANAAAYRAKIVALDESVRLKLAALPPAQRWLVTSEGAFAYLCQHYQLQALFLWPINADAQGTPQQVREVIDRVRAHQVPVVFSESTISPEPIKQVARETGARYGGVLYVDSLTDESGPAPTYLKLLERNAATLLRGFSLAP